MDDKLIRLARKVKTLEDELNKISQIKDLEGLLVASTDMNSRYKKSINETVGMYKEYISNTKKELMDSFEAIKKDYDSKKDSYKKNIDNLEAKINKVKDDIQKVCTSIDKSIEDIQKDILKDIKDKNTQILNEIGKKDKELKEVKNESASLVKDLKALKDLVNKLELQKGEDGKSAYDIACELGFKGTKEEWIKSLHGKDGQDIELRGLRAFSDVKNDNKMYARKNKKWVEVENYDDTEIKEDIEELQEENETQAEQITTLQTENTRLKATLPTTTGTGENITLDKTAELDFIQPPLPMGNSEQVQYSGKNKFTAGTGQTTNTGVTANYNESEIKLNGTTTRDGNIFLDNTLGTLNSYRKIGTFPAGTYFLSFTKLSGSLDFTDGGQSAFYIRKGNDINNQLITIDIAAGTITQTRTFTLTEEATLYCQYYVNKASVVYNNYLFRIQIEEGSTATSYEPYVGGTASPNPSYPQAISNVTGDVEVVVQNKNLVDILTLQIGYVASNGSISTSGIANGERYSNFIKVNPNETYTFKIFETSSSYSDWIGIGEYQSNDFGSFVIRKTGSSNTLTITTSENTNYIIVSARNLANATQIQLEQNTTATTYTPHQEQTFTFPLGTQRLMLGDYLADDGIHHVRKQVTFDGSEDDWRLFFSTQGVFITSNVPNASSNLGTINGLSNRFECTTRNNMRYNLATINNRFSVSANELIIANKAITSVTDFKTWLSTHNVTVEYKLATEEITPYTTEQQQAYDEIKQAFSYEEQTNISGFSDESNPILSVEAYQSIKLILAS